jgi:acyl-coenzyme A synthetase/AMP-(fatty) acid ligase
VTTVATTPITNFKFKTYLSRCLVFILQGKILPIGETGNIAVKKPSPVIFLEYWKNPEATKKKFVGDWLLTGKNFFPMKN